MPPRPPPPSRPFWSAGKLYWIAFLAVLLTAGGWVAFPYGVWFAAERALRHLDISGAQIRRATYNPVSRTLTFTAFDSGTRHGFRFTADAVDLRIDWPELLNRQLFLKHVNLDNARLILHDCAAARRWLQRQWTGGQAAAPASPSPAAAFVFPQGIDRLSLSGTLQTCRPSLDPVQLDILQLEEIFPAEPDLPAHFTVRATHPLFTLAGEGQVNLFSRQPALTGHFDMTAGDLATLLDATGLDRPGAIAGAGQFRLDVNLQQPASAAVVTTVSGESRFEALSLLVAGWDHHWQTLDWRGELIWRYDLQTAQQSVNTGGEVHFRNLSISPQDSDQVLTVAQGHWQGGIIIQPARFEGPPRQRHLNGDISLQNLTWRRHPDEAGYADFSELTLRDLRLNDNLTFQTAGLTIGNARIEAPLAHIEFGTARLTQLDYAPAAGLTLDTAQVTDAAITTRTPWPAPDPDAVPLLLFEIMPGVVAFKEAVFDGAGRLTVHDTTAPAPQTFHFEPWYLKLRDYDRRTARDTVSFDFRARPSGRGTIEGRGTIQTALDTLNLDGTIRFYDIDASTLSPYFEQFAGTRVEKGLIAGAADLTVLYPRWQTQASVELYQWRTRPLQPEDRTFHRLITRLRGQNDPIVFDLVSAGEYVDVPTTAGHLVRNLRSSLDALARQRGNARN